ncbi:MAG: selenocysteine lyase/cysteine desulfurase [Paraglaciecola sp.]|jgi:selenocysteine lyase/cysteine desulfurase
MLSRKIAYLNCAYMSPMMKKVENAGRQGIELKRRPYKVKSSDFFDQGNLARQYFSKIVGVSDNNRNVIIPSVSYAMANVAANLPRKKGNVVVAEAQFPSNVYPWKGYSLNMAKKREGQSWTESILQAINDKTAAVAIGHVHWVDGAIFDLKVIREAATKAGAALIIDGTQSVGALPYDNQEVGADAVVVAGYKWLFGPYGLGMAYYGEMFDDGNPIEQNWINRKGSEDFGGLVTYTEDYHEGALRYEVGEHSNFILLPMLNTAMKQIIQWDPAKSQAYVHLLMKETILQLQEAGYLIAEENERAHHLFGIRLAKGANGDAVKKSLNKHRVNVSFRGDAIRVAPSVYNDAKDVLKLKKALIEAIA